MMTNNNSLLPRIVSGMTGAVAACLWLSTASSLTAQEAAAAETAPPPKKTAWERSAGLGLTITDGNSDTILFSANILASRKWEKNEILLGADATYGEDDGDKNNELFRAFGQYDRLFTDRFYGYFRVEGKHDAIADIEYRVTLSPGAGYYFLKEEKYSLRGEAGPGVIFEKQGRDEDIYMILRLAERFEWKITETSKLWQALEYMPQVDDWQNWLLNAEIGVSTPITKSVDLRAVLQDTYDNEPAPDRTENDLKFITTVNLKF